MRLLITTAVLLFSLSAAGVSIDWVAIGDPGNAQGLNGWGSVASPYRISKFEITNAQYAEFLNAKASSDPLALFNPNMDSNALGGIARSGSSGSFSYTAKAGRENRPVNYVSVFDGMRFSNWLNNGQAAGDTESGAYTLLGGTPVPSNGSAAARDSGANVFLPSENEWFKAAYYDAGGSAYFAYPLGSNSAPNCIPPGANPNAANCSNAVGDVTPVGIYPGSSPYGVFDLAGNVYEWTETTRSPTTRVIRGGAHDFAGSFSASPTGLSGLGAIENDSYGFRIAAVPEPGTGLLLAAGLVGLGWKRSKRA